MVPDGAGRKKTQGQVEERERLEAELFYTQNKSRCIELYSTMSVADAARHTRSRGAVCNVLDLNGKQDKYVNVQWVMTPWAEEEATRPLTVLLSDILCALLTYRVRNGARAVISWPLLCRLYCSHTPRKHPPFGSPSGKHCQLCQ